MLIMVKIWSKFGLNMDFSKQKVCWNIIYWQLLLKKNPDVIEKKLRSDLDSAGQITWDQLKNLKPQNCRRPVLYKDKFYTDG